MVIICVIIVAIRFAIHIIILVRNGGDVGNMRCFLTIGAEFRSAFW